MSNKTLATHLYSLFIFVAGCVVFWLFGGGEEPENNRVDNKEEIMAQPAAKKLAVVEDAQEQRKNIGENDSVYQSTELQENEFISSTVEGDAEVDLSDSKTNSKRRDTKKQVEQDLKECESTIPSSTPTPSTSWDGMHGTVATRCTPSWRRNRTHGGSTTCTATC